MATTLSDLIRQEPRGSYRHIELTRYRWVCSSIRILNQSSTLLAVWASSGGRKEHDFNLLHHLSLLMEAREYFELVTDPPGIPYTPEEIEEFLDGQNGFFRAAERECGKFLEHEFNRRIAQVFHEWAFILEQPIENTLEDPEESGKLYESRDLLEYCLSAIAWFQLDNPDRWKNVHPGTWFQRIAEHNDLFRTRIQQAKKLGKHSTNPLAPDPFWWYK